MDWFSNLLFNFGVAHSILLVAVTIALGLVLNRIKICGVSLGVTWILFVGIFASHFGLLLDATTSHFIKEFGLILFIYSIGIQVGPSFFSSFRKGGVSLNLLATGIVLLGSATAYCIHVVTGEDILAMIGVLYGAVTNTPGLGAAQQTYSDIHNVAQPLFAQGYAVAYPLGVVGIILSIILLKYIFRSESSNEEKIFDKNNLNNATSLQLLTLEVTNEAICGKTIQQTLCYAGREVIASRILSKNSANAVLADDDIELHQNDKIYLLAKPEDVEAVTALFGRKIDMSQEQWEKESPKELVCERLVITNSKWNGKRLGDLGLSKTFHINITRVRRAGVDLIATPDLILQFGDRLTVVGAIDNVEKVKSLLGDSIKTLNEPQLVSSFIGIALGVLLGMIPITFPGMPVPVKLGLAGGPLIVSILIARFGTRVHLVTYMPSSAIHFMRQIGICLFMAAVGLGAGDGFVDIVAGGGYKWILYGFIITFFPCVIMGIVARYVCHRSYFTIAGMISGAMTDPPALAYSNSICTNDQAAVAYSTVYPLTMFLRVLVAQVLVLFV